MRTSQRPISAEYQESLRDLYGLNEPLPVQYFKWIRNIVTKGQFGYSFVYFKDASVLIFERLPMTFAITLGSALLVWILALPIGIYSAVKQYSLGDYIATFFGFIGLAVPNFLLALIFLYLSYRLTGQAMIGLFSSEYADAPWTMAKFWDWSATMALVNRPSSRF